MSLFEGRVNVLSASSSALAPISRALSDLSLDTEDASGNLRNIHGLFAAPNAHDEAQQRAHKRRKVDDNHAVPVHVADAGEKQSIVLANVSLELVSVCVALQHAG
jgi:hypothetical protein